MKDEKVSLAFARMSMKLAEHDLEVTVKRVSEGMFRHAKEEALLSEERAKAWDSHIRGIFDDEPKKIAEWEEVMQKYEFLDDEIDDGR
jgi:hypothetical protein